MSTRRFVLTRGVSDMDEKIYKCRTCHTELRRYHVYCPLCGVLIDWSYCE